MIANKDLGVTLLGDTQRILEGGELEKLGQRFHKWDILGEKSQEKRQG